MRSTTNDAQRNGASFNSIKTQSVSCARCFVPDFAVITDRTMICTLFHVTVSLRSPFGKSPFTSGDFEKLKRVHWARFGMSQKLPGRLAHVEISGISSRLPNGCSSYPLSLQSLSRKQRRASVREDVRAESITASFKLAGIYHKPIVVRAWSSASSRRQTPSDRLSEKRVFLHSPLSIGESLSPRWRFVRWENMYEHARIAMAADRFVL